MLEALQEIWLDREKALTKSSRIWAVGRHYNSIDEIADLSNSRGTQYLIDAMIMDLDADGPMFAELDRLRDLGISHQFIWNGDIGCHDLHLSNGVVFKRSRKSVTGGLDV